MYDVLIVGAGPAGLFAAYELIVNNPKLLICDEPTGNLDPDTSMGIMKVLDDINKMGTTIVMTTHNRDIVNKMKKRVILLDKGRLKKDYEKGTYDKDEKR